MIGKLIAGLALLIVLSGCAASGGEMLQPILNPATGGAPATWPCQASG